MDVSQWWGIFVPAGTPDEIVDKLNDDINNVMNSEETKAFLAKDAAPRPRWNPRSSPSSVQDELARWAQIAADANIRAE